MDTALTPTGIRIDASSANPSAEFRCPVCRVRVKHVSGPVQVPHFRHWPRTPLEDRRILDCPNYVADQAGTSSDSDYGRIAPAPAQPRTHLAVAWIRSARAGQRWALLAAVPVPPAGVANVRIDDYINGSADIHRERVLRDRQFFVRAKSREYHVVGYDRDRRAIWHPLPSDPLTLTGPNFFQAGANGGVQLDPSEPLVKGRSYFVLTRPDAWAEPPVGLCRDLPRVDFCDPRKEWLGFLLYLPRAIRPDVTAWCTSVAKRKLIDPPSELGLVLPPARTMQADGAYRISAGEEIVIALRGGDWREPMLEVVEEQTGRNHEWELEVDSSEFICLGKFEPGAYTVHVRDWQLVSLRLAVVEPSVAEVLGVQLRTTTPDGENELRTGLLEPQASVRWAAVIGGTELLQSIDLPGNWPVTLSWTAKGVGEVSREELSTGLALATALSECLPSDPDRAVLDAGVFGTVFYERPTVQTKTQRPTDRLPVALHARLKWLILAREVSAGSTANLEDSVSVDRVRSLREPDQRLVLSFLGVARWPVALMPQARSVMRELACKLQSER